MSARPTGAPQRVVFVFPGQGSQYPGMMRDLSWCGAEAARGVGEATEVTGLPVRELMTSADAETLTDPAIAQLLVFVHSAVQWRALLAAGVRPGAVAGHSLGEYTALLAAECLEWTDALRLVATRGRAMARAARERPGTMAALVGLDLATVRQLCAQATSGNEQVVVANLNSPRQAVVSGTERAVDSVVAAAKAAGALRARRLPVGGAYHSPLMARAQADLAPLLDAAPLHSPALALVSSVTGAAVTDTAAYRTALRGQITAPVRWEQAVAALAGGPALFVEVGPGRVLTGLDREMVRDATHRTAANARGLVRAELAAQKGSW